MVKYKWLVIYVLIAVVSVIILLTHALNNGFPLLYSDTGSYILSGMEHSVPSDRPLMYGVLIWATGMGVSLWQVAVFQALLVGYMIWLLLKCTFGTTRSSFLILPLVLLLLTVITGVSFYVSFLIPDIFAAVSIFGILLMISFPDMKKPHRIALFFATVIPALTHYSNLINILSVALAFLVLIIFFRRKTFVANRIKSFYFVLFTVIVVFVLNSLLPKLFDESKRPVKSNFAHPFATLLESGLVHEFLRENCDDSSYSFCKNINELPRNHGYFLWNMNSPLYKDCGSIKNCRAVKEEEMGRIIRAMLCDPCYLQGISCFALERTRHQLFHIDVISLQEYNEEYPLRLAIRKYFPGDMNAFLTSCQSNNGYGVGAYNNFMRMVIYMSFILILISFFIPVFSKRIHQNIKVFFWLFLVAMTSNAFVCSVLSSGNSRYQGRIIWIIPAVCLVIIIQLILQLYRERKGKNS